MSNEGLVGDFSKSREVRTNGESERKVRIVSVNQRASGAEGEVQVVSDNTEVFFILPPDFSFPD